jgi:hypothetical protein
MSMSSPYELQLAVFAHNRPSLLLRELLLTTSASLVGAVPEVTASGRTST